MSFPMEIHPKQTEGWMVWAHPQWFRLEVGPQLHNQADHQDEPLAGGFGKGNSFPQFRIL
jgi:hypothetical protein